MNGQEKKISTSTLSWTETHQVALAIGLATLLLIALHYYYAITEFPYDAGLYWGLSDPIAFRNSTQTARGYFFPLLLSPLRYASTLIEGEPLFLYRVMLSGIYGAALTTMIPKLYISAFGGTISLSRRLVPVTVLAIIFPGVLLYPLSDLPAFLMMCGALLCLLIARRERGITKGKILFFLAISGLLSAAAYNTRTIYIFPVIIVFCAVLFWPRDGEIATKRLSRVLAFSIGAALLSLPQGFINEEMYGKFRLTVNAKSGGRSLFVSQLAWGMTLQRYETNISKGYTNAGVFYLDPAGENLIGRIRQTQPMLSMSNYLNNISQNPFDLSVPSYLRLVSQYPLDFMGIYARHAINGLDVRDGLVYTQRFSTTRNGKSLLNFALLALACWILLLGRPAATAVQSGNLVRWQSATPNWPAWLAVLLLPVLTIIPGAIETRFFLPLHLLAYCAIAFRGDPAALLHNLRHRYFLVASILAVSASVFFAVTLSTMANLHKF